MSHNIVFKDLQHRVFLVRSCFFSLQQIDIFPLAALGIPFQILPDYHDGAGQALETAKRYMETAKGPYALLVKRQTFLPYSLSKKNGNGDPK
jgi:hypothetical protein